ncbi:hypothetical protein OGAPHI_002320 [Ogataea philodendri]|uniref:F-box domain-containing protein n=1 Tax=Ogataea philodendri TaxID=1378263 RepID=A0A9P8T772_9ASCO|nr:uncharacterized protein OGAPHI_002320 [Ogataea philodendri]KAH3668566.1 hypothetical protein OGAPHI_002320 [Ogataea philodendri]
MFIRSRGSSVISIGHTHDHTKGQFKIPLERFPETAIRCIMSHLDTSDLLSFSCLGDSFASAATPFIYRSLVFADSKDNQSDTLIDNYRGFLRLVYTLMIHPDRGQHVVNLKIEDNKNEKNDIWNVKLSEILPENELEAMNGVSDLTLFDALDCLLQLTPNLKSLHVPALTIEQFSNLPGLNKVEEITIHIRQEDTFHELPLNNLKRLSICCEKNTESILGKLAIHLNKIGVLSNLNSLTLSYKQTGFNEIPQPTWYAFLHPLSGKVFHSLKDLTLAHCQLSTKQQYFAGALVRTIPFAQLESLHLSIYESSHKGRKHVSDAPVLLNMLAPHFENLRKLIIQPSGNCLLCQVKSVIDFLHLYPHLHELCLFTNSLNTLNRDDLTTALSKSKNLHKLAIFDEAIHLKLTNHLKKWFIYENMVKFKAYDHFESELLCQMNNFQFEKYSMDAFKTFNTENANLLILFWRKFLTYSKSDELIKNCASATHFKLYGYNFRILRSQQVIQLYTGIGSGYQNLMYY